MFAQIDSLPSPQLQSSVADGDGNAGAQQRRFDMGRHVVGAFDGVNQWLVLGNHSVKDRFKVGSNVRVCVLVDG